MSADVHELYQELERVRRDVATLLNQLGDRGISLYAQLEAARAREAAILEQLAG